MQVLQRTVQITAVFKATFNSNIGLRFQSPSDLTNIRKVVTVCVRFQEGFSYFVFFLFARNNHWKRKVFVKPEKMSILFFNKKQNKSSRFLERSITKKSQNYKISSSSHWVSLKCPTIRAFFYDLITINDEIENSFSIKQQQITIKIAFFSLTALENPQICVFSSAKIIN